MYPEGVVAAEFPALRGSEWKVTSELTDGYNCVAWAAEDNTRWWWPDAAGQYYWPEGVPRSEAVESFIAVFVLLGYQTCSAVSATEPGYQSIAIWSGDAGPTHIARLKGDGRWTSKLGQAWDISHELHGLNGHRYGTPTVFLRRVAARDTDSTAQ